MHTVGMLVSIKEGESIFDCIWRGSADFKLKRKQKPQICFINTEDTGGFVPDIKGLHIQPNGVYAPVGHIRLCLEESLAA